MNFLSFIDAKVAAFVAALTVVTGVTFGLLPSLRASRHHVTAALKESGTRSATGGAGRLRTLLVVVEVAIAVVVLVGSGLVIRGFLQLMSVNPGFRPSNLLTLRIVLPEAAYGTEDRRRAFVDQALARIRSLAGAEQAAVVSSLPLAGGLSTYIISIEGTPPPLPGRYPVATFVVASPGYFETLGIPIRRGRTFDERDGRPATDPVVIVSETLAARHWPGQDPIGRVQSEVGLTSSRLRPVFFPITVGASYAQRQHFCGVRYLPPGTRDLKPDLNDVTMTTFDFA